PLRERIDALVRTHALDTHVHASGLRLNALACVSLPTCGLAMAEAERFLPELLDKTEVLLDTHGLRDAQIHLRISGCPNGCSRPYLGEIALVGKASGRYNLMLGADHRGQRLNALHRENIDEAAILSELDALFARYARERGPGQYFGDFLIAAGIVAIPAKDTRHAIPLELVP
ncbi:MAG TPA: sulfite reductase, partial [Thermomonas sp.]|nr:sulfite reductase [Thermomonas sp.]